MTCCNLLVSDEDHVARQRMESLCVWRWRQTAVLAALYKQPKQFNLHLWLTTECTHCAAVSRLCFF